MKKDLIIKTFIIFMIASFAFAKPHFGAINKAFVQIKCWQYFLSGISYRDSYRYDKAIGEFNKAIELNPNFYQAHNELGVVHREKGRIEPSSSKAQIFYEEAVIHHKKAIEINPDYEIAYASLGYTYICMRGYDSAMREFVEALRINPSSHRAHLGLGWIYNEMDIVDEAIKEYQNAIKLEPKSEAGYNNLGWAYIKNGEFDSAICSLKKAISLSKNYAIAYKNLGEAYLCKKMFIEARKNFEKSISLGDKDPYTHIFIYITLLSQGEESEAKEKYEKIFTLFPDKSLAHRAIGWSFWRHKLYKEALLEYKMALKINPDKSLYYYEIGNVYRDMKEYGKALIFYKKALEKDTQFCSAWHEAGRIFAIKGEKERCFSYMKKAIENYPFLECSRLYWLLEKDPLTRYINEIEKENISNFIWFYGFMGWVFEKSEDQRAAKMYEKTIALSPNSSQVSMAYEGLGRIYKKMGDYEESIKYFKKSIDINPSSPFSHYLIASIYYIQGENLKAIIECENALKKKKEAFGYLGIGDCWEKEGEIDKAIDVYKEGIKNLPDASQKIVSRLYFLEFLSRFHLIGLYTFLRKTETRMERYFSSKGLTPKVERISNKIERIYKSKIKTKPLILRIFAGIFILLIFFAIILFPIGYLKARKKFAKLSKEKIALLEERMDEKINVQKIKSSFLGLALFILGLCLIPFLYMINPRLPVISILLAIGGGIYDGNYGLIRRWRINYSRRKLFRSYGENLLSILGEKEKIWYYIDGGRTMLYYVITSERILCYPASLFGEAIKGPSWIAKFEDIERIKKTSKFISILSFSLKSLTVFLKDGSKRKIIFLPMVDIDSISYLIESKISRILSRN